MRIDGHAIKISGAKIEVDKEFPVGTYDISFKVVGDIVKEETTDNQDGTVSKTYILRATTSELID